MTQLRDAVNEFMALARNTEAPSRHLRTLAFLEGERLDALLGLVSAGTSLRDSCAMAEITYATIQKRLTEDAELRPLYEAARMRQAEAVLDELAEIERKVEEEKFDPKAAQVLIGSKQWRAERLNPKRYGPRSFQHIETVDNTKLHLEAVRQLARDTRAALAHQLGATQALPVIEGEFVDVTPGAPESPQEAT
jgi:type IV secretory pathway VirJ component